MRIFPTPSEGEMKKRGNYSPSEGGHGVAYGKMRLQAALGEVAVLRIFARWDENAGKWLTFGRCGGCRICWLCWFGD